MTKIIKVEKTGVVREGTMGYPKAGNKAPYRFYLMNTTDGEIITSGLFESIDRAIEKLTHSPYRGEYYLQEHGKKERYTIAI